MQTLQETIREKIAIAAAGSPKELTRRTSVRIPAIPGKAKAVVGMRRSGKSTFLHQVIQDRLRVGNPQERLIYFNFEDERLAGMQGQDLGLVLEEYFVRYPGNRNSQTVTFFFDEIQLVPGWETFVRRILDSEDVEIFLSGSSAKMLSREVATSMRGRSVEATVYPFSFSETLAHLGLPIPENAAFLTPKERSVLENAFGQYLVSGGFPEAQGLLAADRRHLLQTYVDVVILRDIAERHQLTNLAAIRWLVRQLLANAGGAFSANKFHKILQSQQIRGSVEGILEIFSHLEDAFLVHGVPIEAASERKRQVNPRKAYPVDPGFIPVFDRTGRANIGHALENLVLIELLRRNAEVTWIRTPQGYEIDFFVRYPDGVEELIQVAAEFYSSETVEREFRALQDASRLFPEAKLRLLTLRQGHGLEPPPGLDVVIQPTYEWLLV